MDPAQLHDANSGDHLPEVPLGTSTAAAYGNAAIHNLVAHRENSHELRAPHDAQEEEGRRHVSVGHFDREGVDELKRTMSRMSTAQRSEKRGAPSAGLLPTHASHHSSDRSSDHTLAPGDGPFDFEKSLQQMVRRKDESDIKRRELGVVFDNLRVVGLGASVSYQPTLGSTLNPFQIFETIKKIRHPPVKDILSGFEGCVKPGEMLLVLGRPGAGCSTMLKTLANQRQDYHQVLGDVWYDDFTPQEIEKQYRGDVQYCPEDDVHFATLTVRQTLDFAAKTRTPRARVHETREQHRNTMIDVLTTIFGLRHVRDTLVGDASVRGVSGGEKKRVSISEVLAARSLLTSWDNSTRGLDASTALEFVRALRLATDVARVSTIVSIYQAGEQLYQLFDKVCVIYEGKMAYFGPASSARQYFIDMGYEPANRQTTADFLVAVTDPNGRIPRANYSGPPPPRNADEFAAYFKNSELGRLNRDDMRRYREEESGMSEKKQMYRLSHRAEHAKTTSKKSPFIISIAMQARALMLRRVQIIQGAIATQVIQALSFVFQAIIVGTIFLRLDNTTGTFFSKGGVLFFALLFAALSTMAEIPALFIQRPIVQRHSRAAMYHPFVEGLALTLVDIPITAFTLILFGIILYFLVGLQENAGKFFIFLLYIFSMTITMKGWFRMLAAMFKSPAPAQAIAGVSVLLLTLYTGYTIPQPSMIGALRWITYINPLKYGFEGLVVNEFHGLQASYEDVSLANQVCTTVGSVPGQATVEGMSYVTLSFGYAYSHLWRNFGIICAFGIGFISILLVLTEFNLGLAGDSSVTLFKRGSKATIAQPKGTADEEKSGVSSDGASTRRDAEGVSEEAQKALEEVPAGRNTFSFENLTYIVPVQGGKRKLLDNVSGYVAPGKLTALMGESGAGKTTLLNVLSDRTAGGVVTGDRLMNGQSLPIDFRSQTGYVQQMDTHLPTATVREALLFSAKLRQPASVPIEEKEAWVDNCLKMCGLENFADAVVGSLGVEQRKRTTIGVELVAKPSLIFLDEPTSGLDSQSAWAIVCFLRSLADAGQSIVCTIHQPSAELFEVFDRLLLLRKGGQTVYFGDLGQKSSTLINYFESNGGRVCKEDENPAEYILDVIGAGATATTDIEWHDAWKKSQEAQNVNKDLEHINAEGRERPPVQASMTGAFPTRWGYQLWTLLSRDLQYRWRDPSYMVAKLGVNIAAGLLIGFTFFKAKDSIQGTQNKLFAIFMSTIISVPLSNQLQVPFLDSRQIYEIRERHSSMYSWTAFLTSQILVELPWNILGSTIYFLCWFWTVGFPSDRGGFTYLMLGVVFPLYYTTIGQAVAAMCPNAEIAALVFSFLFSFVLSFNGVLQPFRELGWWQWMYRLSPFTYLIEGMLGQAIGHSTITCASTELVTIEPPSGQTCGQYMGTFISSVGGYLTNGDATSKCQYCAYSTTDAFLGESFNIFYSNHWRDFGIFCAYIVSIPNADGAATDCLIFVFSWLFRFRSGSMFGWVKKLVRRQ
ncbi:pleiotropic drug resistance ABC transporter [Fomitopsis serialis]|uniref:pleiotropic drug resistance ABC transporter n=1 Tax=Fomitopsis serialis TaxID=139415 RepID=UPI00200802D6|nr:pleiotropic drug resistance ABC transporter [Neoantrodia serialis]KAH9934163.1 pleiotropic drug resistance ABC transporter [Neoantrodia serialis]